MKKYIFPAIVTAALGASGIYSAVLSNRCDELREKQARQEAILLKQGEILALNTAMLHTLVMSRPPKDKTIHPGKEGLKMDAMP